MEYTSKAQLVTQMKINLETRKDVRIRALLRIFENQTFDEQRTESTNRYNGIGFTGSDARFLSSLAKQYKYKKFLTDKQDAVLRRKIVKYAAQLVNGSINEGKIRYVDGKYIL